MCNFSFSFCLMFKEYQRLNGFYRYSFFYRKSTHSWKHNLIGKYLSTGRWECGRLGNICYHPFDRPVSRGNKRSDSRFFCYSKALASVLKALTCKLGWTHCSQYWDVIVFIYLFIFSILTKYISIKMISNNNLINM